MRILKQLLAVPGLSLLVCALPAIAEDYPPAVKDVIEHRCVVCHGCYDAPCQLKMDDWIGLQRGASKQRVYDGSRLITANLTRLYEDALSTAQWRDKGFYPVLDEERGAAGTLYQMLALKERHPLPTSGTLPDSFDLRLNRDQSCPKPGEFERYRERRPQQGMPFGLPGLDEERLATLRNWLESGAAGVPSAQRPPAELEAVARWDEFLNGGDNTARLMSRYIYEHLFVGDLYFDQLDTPSAWYRLVRSRTPPGKPIDIIATRRPYDDPGADRFYYRLQLRQTTRLAKRHMPYALNPERRARWEALFLSRDYAVDVLPGYGGDDNANPFLVYEQLPVASRYRFMLDEAHFTIQAYIKGPVCRGQVALNVIDDHFWVAFVEPNPVDPEQSASFLANQAKRMRLPQGTRGLVVSLLQWNSYAKDQQRYLRAEARSIAELVDKDAIALDMDLIWDGNGGSNDNAALTVFRHFDSATVVKGLVGQQPKTMWVIDYSLLERIHYLLVAGFDVYGKLTHQLESRLYMDFLRMEGEKNFLGFLPEDQRAALRDYWYRDAKDYVRDYLLSPENAEYERSSAIQYASDDPKSELMDLFRQRIPAASNQRYDVRQPALQALMATPSRAFSFMPEVAFLQVLQASGEPRSYTLLRNSAHSNIAQLFDEDKRRLPEEDTMTVTRGFVGAYPNIFFQVNERELTGFAEAVVALEKEADYVRLVERFGVRRTAPWFWKLSDDLYAEYRRDQPVEAGLFDLNRYENR